MVEACAEMSARGSERRKKTTRAETGPGGIAPAAPCVAAGVLSVNLPWCGRNEVSGQEFRTVITSVDLLSFTMPAEFTMNQFCPLLGMVLPSPP